MTFGPNKPTDYDLSQRQLGIIHEHINLMKILPESGQTWLSTDVEIENHLFGILTGNDIVHRRGKRRIEPGRFKQEFETDPTVYEYVTDLLEGREDAFLPCGHEGFTNGGDTLTCTICGTEHDKSEVRQ